MQKPIKMLNNSQKKVALELTGNTIVSASPGTGKTKTLVARAQKKLGTLPKHKKLALITYTNAAADEISDRLNAESNEAFIGTIHRFCLEFILRPFGWIYHWNKPRVVAFGDLQTFLQENQQIQLGENPIDELNKLKKTVDGNLDLSVEWDNGSPIKDVAELYYAFLESKKAIDFNEILYRSYKLISENEFIRQSLANKFYEIAIDEFQDTNIFQYEIFKAIGACNRCTFFIVGDEKQRIYAFAGAIENAFELASADFGSEIHLLDTTYRSTNNIVAAYSCLFENHLKLENESDYKNTTVDIVFGKTTNDTNNKYIESYINWLIENKIPLSEIAILTRSWRDAYFISQYLRTKFHVVGLGALPHKSSPTSSFTLLKSISRFLVSSNIRYLRSIKRNLEFHVLENNLSLSEKDQSYALNNLIALIKRVDPEGSLIDGLQQIKDIFDAVFKTGHSDLEEVISQIQPEEGKLWTLDKYIKTIAGVDGITINTIHQAKGLEYEAVILNNVSENKIPFQLYLGRRGSDYLYANLTEENLAAGRTLLYVGMSRAKRVLIITHGYKQSMFLPAIAATNIKS